MVVARRLCLVGLCAVIAAAQAHAQLSPLVSPATILENSAAAAGESVTLGKDLANTLNTLETAMAAVDEAMNTVTIIQNQVQALQSLGQGDWQGFVQAVNYETEAIATVNSAFQQLPQLNGLDSSIASYTQGTDYKTASQALSNLAQNWANFDNVVQQTNGTIQDMKYRAKLEQGIMSQSEANNQNGRGSVVTQLQLTTQQLGLLQGTLGDMENTTLSAQIYEQGIHDQAVAQMAANSKLMEQFELGYGSAVESETTPEEMRKWTGIQLPTN